MLSAANLQALDDAGVGFIVGSRQTKAPYDLATRLEMGGTYFADGEVTETITPRHGQANRESNRQVLAEPVWDPAVHTGSWRAVWQYRTKRATRESATPKAQWERAQDAVSGARPARKPRFVTIRKGDMSVDEDTYKRAQATAGMKGYVTNLPASRMDATEVIASYHALWHVEASFRMSKHDLAARPVFHHTKDTIDAHLTVVIASLAVARYLATATGMTTRTIVRELRAIQTTKAIIAGHPFTIDDPPTPQATAILQALGITMGH